MTRTAPAPRTVATRADLESLPEGTLGEIIEGVLYTAPRPRPRHVDIETFLAAELKYPFQRGRGGPGGWWILIEPGIELPRSPEVVPDLAGWKKDRLPSLPEDGSIRIVPDWVCEILSPSTRRHDQRIKRPFYARIGVRLLWLIDLDARTLIVNRLEDGRWHEWGVFGESDVIRAEPFHDIEIRMTEWWSPES